MRKKCVRMFSKQMSILKSILGIQKTDCVTPILGIAFEASVFWFRL